MISQKLTDKEIKSYVKLGIISDWYLRDDQLRMYDYLTVKKKVVVNTHRRYGKSTTAFVYIFERCLTEKIIVRCGGQTQKSFKDIYNTIADQIFDRCPEFKPKWDYDEGCYKFHTGSKLFIFGMSDKAEADKGRGALAHIIYCDEYGFWAYRANYMLTSVLSPQLDTTDGTLIITSTPPEDLTHDYIKQVSNAGMGDYYYLHDIDMSIKMGIIDDATHEKIIMRCGGKDTDAYKREYQCMLIASTQRLVIPEAQDTTLYEHDWKRPDKLQPNVYLDLGLKDNSFGVFGYVDFIAQKLVIEDELMVNYKTTSDLVRLIKKKEEQLGFPEKYVIRKADAQPQQVYDIANDYKLPIMAIQKMVKGDQNDSGYKEGIINALRVNLSIGRLRINPRCKELIKQLKYGIYNELRTDFERTQELGHLDGMMALAYMNYHIDWNYNPYPHPYLSLNRFEYYVPKIFRKKSLNDIY